MKHPQPGWRVVLDELPGDVALEAVADFQRRTERLCLQLEGEQRKRARRFVFKGEDGSASLHETIKRYLTSPKVVRYAAGLAYYARWRFLEARAGGKGGQAHAMAAQQFKTALVAAQGEKP